MARAVTCACGASFTGADDEDLFRQTRQHAQEQHADLQMTDDQIRGMISSHARDV